MVHFREVNSCIMCGSTKLKPRFSYTGMDGKTYTCCRCCRCELVFGNPLPVLDAQSINEIYSSDYYSNYFGANCDYSKEDSDTNVAVKKRHRREFNMFMDFYGPADTTGKNVLDIGCGDGRFLEIFREQGWNCYGFEPADFSRAKAIQKGLNVTDKPLASFLPEERRYDFIFMDNVIEHLDNPAADIAKVFSLLNPRGVFALKTPNSSAVLEQLETTLLRLAPPALSNKGMALIKKKLNMGSGTVHRYGNLHPPVHLAIFNKKSITMGLQKAGFAKEDIAVCSGSEYYKRWRVPRDQPKSLFGKTLKLLKQTGDLLGKGDQLVAMARKK